MKTLLSPMLFYFYKNSLKNSPLAGNTKHVFKALTVRKMFCLAALLFLANFSFAQRKVKPKGEPNAVISTQQFIKNSFSKGIAGTVAIPWSDGLETSTVGNLILPDNWTSGQASGSRNRGGVSDGTIDYNGGSSRTGIKYFYSEWNCTNTMVLPGFALTAGKTYIFSFWATRTNYSNDDDFKLGIKYSSNSSQVTYAAMSNTLRSSSNITPNSYTKYSYSFTPTTTDTYYIGMEISGNGNAWQLNFDDFSLVERCANLPFVLPTFEGFNNNELPCGWADTRIRPTGNSYMNFPTVSAGGSVSPQEGDGMVQYQSIAAGSGSSERLETPAFSTIGMCSVTTSFKWHNTTTASGNGDDVMQPQYNIGAGWVSFGSSFPRESTSVGWVDKNFDLPPDALNKTNVKIGFLFQSKGGNSMFMDNVIFTPKYSPTITTQPSKNNSVCLDGAVTPLSVVAGGTGPFTYQWYYNTTDSNTVAGATMIAGATSSTYSPPSNAVGTRYYFVVVKGSCATGTVNSVNSNTAVFTVTPASVGGTITAAQTICSGTAPSDLILNGNVGNVIKWQKATDASFSAGLQDIASTATTLPSALIGNLTTNTYFRAVVQNGVCGVVYSNPVLITVGPGTTTTFTGGTDWSDGFPNINKKAVFAADYNTANGNITACNCEVQLGIKLTIGKDSNATIQNNIVNNGDIIIESDGNLVQNSNDGTYSGSGKFTLLRDSKMKRLDYTYWGTPVEGQTLKTFSPNTVTNRFYSYNETDDSFSVITPLTNPMVKGQGYVIRAPNNFTTALQTWTATFNGKPNNGTVDVAVTKLGGGKNLVGNPYPSNIDLVQLTTDNSTVLTGTYYFWTNYATWTSNTEGIGTIGNYNGNGYAVWNGSGGVQATSGVISVGAVPTRYVKPGQGFLAEASQAGTVSFKNGIRTKDGGASPFFNRGTSDQNSEEAVSRFWLTLSTPVQTVSTVLVSYVQGATNAYDPGFDAQFPSEVSDRFFTLNNDKEFLIQGRQFPLTVTDVVSLGMSHYADGNYTIALAEREGVFATGQNVYLRDKATGTVTNLSEGSYTYSAVHGISSDRFEIIYEPQTVLAADGTVKENIQVYRDGSDFVIKSPGKKITGIEVYDTSGKLIIEEAGKQSEVRVSGAGWVNGIYILKIYSNGQVSTRKILK